MLCYALCDDAMFIASCINGSIAHVISWPDEIERCSMGALNPHFLVCVGIIDDVLVDIFHHWNNPLDSKWFDGREIYIYIYIYCMNNTVVISNKGSFLHLDLEFPSLFHDVTILHNANLYKRWCDHFIHMEAYF